MITGKRIYLRELEENDTSLEYCNWLNDPLVNKFLETRNATIEELKQYIREKKNKQDCLFFGIFLRDTDKHIGNVKLEPIDFENETAELGILIGDKSWWSQGICTEVVKLLIKYSFKNLKLSKIRLGVISENKAAIECYFKAGLEVEQIKKRSIRHDNLLYDKYIMSIKKKR